VNGLQELVLHDCTEPGALIKAIIKHTDTLLSLIFADSAYKKHTPSKKGAPASAISGVLLSAVFQRHPELKRICIFKRKITGTTGDKIVGTLPNALKELVLVQAEGDVLRPTDYETLAQQCPQIESLGTTMCFVEQDKATLLARNYKGSVSRMFEGLYGMQGLEGVTIFRFVKRSNHRPLGFASSLFQHAAAQRLNALKTIYASAKISPILMITFVNREITFSWMAQETWSFLRLARWIRR
jgi:hypothetical protein